ncbi:MAG TPA: ATP-binding protein, partial [Candidatus Paceibacterota bacterium]|nr:ATP-binding protein [Candidatus Paceibacterota bacterium]
MMNHIPKLVVTGGPCAGKTTLLSLARTWCEERGYNPLIVPEAATAYINGGVHPRSATFQELVMRFVLTLEETFDTAAKGLQKPVIILDRGLFDQKAYTGQGEFERLCAMLGIIPEERLQNGYDGVLFLDSAAKGAEAFYSSESNPARYEPPEEAVALNERTRAAWMGVPHLITIENRAGQSFEGKMIHAVRALARLLGEP